MKRSARVSAVNTCYSASNFDPLLAPKVNPTKITKFIHLSCLYPERRRVIFRRRLDPKVGQNHNPVNSRGLSYSIKHGGKCSFPHLKCRSTSVIRDRHHFCKLFQIAGVGLNEPSQEGFHNPWVINRHIAGLATTSLLNTLLAKNSTGRQIHLIHSKKT